MLVAENRPRNLHWFHAGSLLFGDWGTSRLYVLGLAFYYTGHASIYYLAAMCLIMAVVAWGYTIVCRCFPDGGGVYSAARRINPLLSVIAATLLLCGFVITASLSALEGFHYLGVENKRLVVALAIGIMGLLGLLNWYGARASGRAALAIALAAVAASVAVGLMCVPLLPEGLRTATMSVDGVDTTWDRWESLVRIVLALSGVEAVASMTGLMKPPVERTAKRTLWPVLVEVVVLNLIFCVALNALPGRAETKTPDYVVYEQRMGLRSDLTPPDNAPPELIATFQASRPATEDVLEYRQTAVKVLADEAGGRMFGERAGGVIAIAAGIIFGLLLLSAANTAILASVSVFYALGQDSELPRSLTRLNYSGVPWIGLILAAAAPAAVLLVVHDDKALGELYAIGVVGAIAINLVCCAANRELPIKRWERAGLWTIGLLMCIIELTIIVAKPNATIFAGSIIAATLAARALVHRGKRPAPLPVPEAGWLEEIKLAAASPPASGPRIMLAARGRDQAEFAVDLARRRKASLFAIFVRAVNLLDVQPGKLPRIEDDPQAQETLGEAATLAKRAGVPFVPIYVTSADIAEEILDYTVTFGCDTLIMGKTRRSLFSRRLAGDVVGRVAEALPAGVSLVTRAAGPFTRPETVKTATPPDNEPPAHA